MSGTWGEVGLLKCVFVYQRGTELKMSVLEEERTVSEQHDKEHFQACSLSMNMTSDT